MGSKSHNIYEFDGFRLVPSEQILTRYGENIGITPKAFDLLAILVENQGRLLTKEDLLHALWADSFVEEANLNVTVSALRRVLGETPTEHRYIVTVPRRGYRFVADVSVSAAEPGQSEILIEPQTVDTSFKNEGFFLRKRMIIYVLGTLTAVLIGLLVWNFAFRTERTNVASIRTIAILPFRPLASEEVDEALQMGMADALITKLSSIQQITVRPTSSVSKFAEGNSDPVTAGRELQVEAVLDGRIQRAENKIRVSVQLLRVGDGSVMWAESFDDFFTNIFAVQDSISERLTASLAMKISGKEMEMLTKRYTENTEAYALLLQARYFHEKLTVEDTRKALEFYQAAIEKDPHYALAYTSRSGAYGFLAAQNIDPEENIRKDRESVLKALSLDPNLGEAYADLADLQAIDDWNFVEAEKSYRKALELAPNEENVYLQYSYTLSKLGRHDEAISLMERAVQMNPVSPFVRLFYVNAFYFARRYDEMVEQSRKALEIAPDDPKILRFLVLAYSRTSMHAEAEALLPKYLEQSHSEGEVTKAIVYLSAGKKEEGEKILREQISLYKEGEMCYPVARLYALLGEKEKALEFLEKAVARHERQVTVLRVVPDFDFLHSEPRFQDLARRVGLPQ